MRRFLGTVVVGLLATGIVGADAAKDELAKLQGDWSLVRLQEDGKSMPNPEVNKVMIKGNRLTVVLKRPDSKKEERHSVKIKLDPTRKPKAIDLTAEDGPDKGQTILGIYELRADTLTICSADPPKSKGRPKEFTAKQGSGRALMVLKRSKK
jgi:uncharacterized protein (TIGR03067 family)